MFKALVLILAALSGTLVSMVPSRAFASPNEASLAQQFELARQRPENYCRQVITEGTYNGAKKVVVLVDKASFCTYLLQLDESGEVISVFSTPNSLGRVGSETLAGQYSVSRSVIDPVWVNPETGARISSYSVNRGNPLGVAAITLRPESQIGETAEPIPTPAEINMALHGTNRPALVGKQRVSASCIRHFNWAIVLMVQALQVGERVQIVNKIEAGFSLPVSDFQ